MSGVGGKVSFGSGTQAFHEVMDQRQSQLIDQSPMPNVRPPGGTPLSNTPGGRHLEHYGAVDLVVRAIHVFTLSYGDM